MKVYETIMLWALCFIEAIENGFIKFFPYIAGAFSLIFAVEIAGALDIGCEINITSVVITAWIVTGLTLLWVIKSHKKKNFCETRNKMQHKTRYN